MKTQYFKQNQNGRDFVVGDIHGCYDKLNEALKAVGFNTKEDRLFAVGDLVDRGLQNLDCIDLINQSWFHSVRGNHEEMLLKFAEGDFPADVYIENGGGWFARLNNLPLQRYIIESIEALPYAIQIDTDEGIIGIVHAGVEGNNWQAFIEREDDKALAYVLFLFF